MLKYFVDNYLYRKEIKFGKGKKVNTNLYIFARNVVNRLFKNDGDISDSEKKIIIIKYLDFAFKRAKREKSIFANALVDSFKEYTIQENSIEKLKRVSSNFNNPYK